MVKKLMYEWELEGEFSDMVDSIETGINLWNIEYSFSQVMKTTDSVRWKMAFRDYFNAQIEDGQLIETEGPLGQQCWEVVDKEGEQ